jgi:cold-inducible RNA-binding protein
MTSHGHCPAAWTCNSVANWEANMFSMGASVNSPKGEKSSGSEKPYRGKGKKLMSMKLHIGNLSFDTSSNELQTLFAQAGTVERVSLIEDSETGRSRGFGFIEMSTKEEGAAAIEKFNGQELGGRKLKVAEAKQRENRIGF